LNETIDPILSLLLDMKLASGSTLI